MHAIALEPGDGAWGIDLPTDRSTHRFLIEAA